MAKQARFEPVELKGEDRTLPWRVNVPPKFSETGNRERRFFGTKAEAKTFIQQTRTRIGNHGTATHGLTAVQREAAAAAFKLLGDAPASHLIEVVRTHLAAKKQQEKSVTFSELCAEFLKAKAKRSEPYHRQLRASFAKFAGLDELFVTEIEPDQIRELVKNTPPSAFNAHLRVAKAAFNFAIKRKWLAANPIKHLDFEEIDRDEVEVLRNDEVVALLDACRHLDWELLPYHLFGIYAGIRPKELERMEWEDVRLDEHHILLHKGVTKRNYRRVIDIEDALAQWLRWFIAQRGKQSGSITPQTNLRRRLRSIRQEANITEWVQDVMRHTYASNWLAKHESMDRLRSNLGHRTSEILLNHYHKAIPRKEAEKFWAILPPTESAKRKPVGG